MSQNTKARSLEIYNAAVSAVDKAGGITRIDNVADPLHHRDLYRQMYKDVMAATGCKIDAAKRNVAKAMRRGRYAEMISQWGGPREGSGYPKGVPRKSKEE